MAKDDKQTNGNGKAGDQPPAAPPQVDKAMADLEEQARLDAEKVTQIKAQAQAKAEAEAELRAQLEKGHSEAVALAEEAEAKAAELRANANHLAQKLDPALAVSGETGLSAEQAHLIRSQAGQQKDMLVDEPRIDMVFPRPVNFYDHLARLWKFPAGTHGVPVSIKDNPHLAAAGVKAPNAGGLVQPAGVAVQ
jgi:hypothetical protein